MIQFQSDELWSSIKKYSRKSKNTKVAVAYFGTGASDLIVMKKGDTLIVAMTIENVKIGLVNPFEIEKLFNTGVIIYNLPNLNSKIYLFDRTAIIGSPNMSNHSVDTLIEAGIVTDDTLILEQVELFIERNSVEKIEQDYIEICKENYNLPKFGLKKRKKTNEVFKGILSRLWIISTKPMEFRDVDYKALEKDKKVFEDKILNKRTFELEDIKYKYSDKFINTVQEGDIVIEIINYKTRAHVLQAKRALGVSFNKRENAAYLRVEERKVPIMKGWAKLRDILIRNDVKSISKNSTKEIKSETTKRILLNYFN